MTNKKLELTRTLIKELPEEQKITLGDAMSTWWISKMTQNSFRLTDVGCDTFVKVLDIQYYTFKISVFTISPNILLGLSKQIKSPYYLSKKKAKWDELWLFGGKEAMAITLWGDVEKFLSSMK